MPTAIERRASALFSTRLFRPVLEGIGNVRLDDAVSQLREDFGLAPSTKNAIVVSAAYETVEDNYRSEYFYKNLITSKIFIGRHRGVNAALFTEFRVGDSVADCVLINGKGVVYEIKTEFDSPDKLEHQLESYYKAFPYVNVVVHAKDSAKYLKVLDRTPAGLLAVGRRGVLSSIKEASHIEEFFETRTIFNTLRQAEVSSILTGWYGSVPAVPNGVRYQTQLAMAEQIPVREFQQAMQATLKLRSTKDCNRLLTDPSLHPLRSVILQLNPTPKQGKDLVTWLNSKAN